MKTKHAMPGKAEMYLRTALGVLLLAYGVNKFMVGFDAYVESIMTWQSNSLLPEFAVKWFTYAIPFLEVIIGVWLISGIKRCCSLCSAGALFIAFGVGHIFNQDPVTVAGILPWIIIAGLGMSLPQCCDCCKKEVK